MEGKHLVILCNLSFGDKTIASHALIDCRATGVAFVDEDFARHHQLPLTPLKYPRALEVIDGRPISSGDITHTANATLSIHEHQEKIPMFVTKLGHYPIVFGIPWMELHDVGHMVQLPHPDFWIAVLHRELQSRPQRIPRHQLRTPGTSTLFPRVKSSSRRACRKRGGRRYRGPAVYVTPGE